MTTIAEHIEEITHDFKLFGEDWEAKYEYLIDMGKSLKGVAENEKTDDRLIRGCQSRLWLITSFEDGRVVFNADSDAIITRGIVALFIKILSNQKAQDIVDANLNFVTEIGLKDHLSPTRANGMLSLIRQMKMDALALQSKM